MKLSKKLIAAFSVAAMLVTALSVTGCKKDDDDDDMIQGSNKNYSINVSASEVNTDEKAAANRGYKSTTFEHRGELVRFTFNNSKDDGGVLGFIWDLENNKEKLSDGEKVNNRNFFVLGLATNYLDGKIQYYVSKYYNVRDISARNFGAHDGKDTVKYTEEKAAAGTTCENDLSKGFKDLVSTSAEKVVIWADIYPTVNNTQTHKAGATDPEASFTGGWSIDFYKGTADSETLGEKIGDTFTIDPKDTGYVAGSASSGTKIPQNYLAVYANVYKDKALNGAWFLKHDYYHDDVVEE